MLGARSIAMGRLAMRSAQGTYMQHAVGLASLNLDNVTDQRLCTVLAAPQPRAAPMVAKRMFSNTVGTKLASFVELEIREEEEVLSSKDDIATTLGDSPFKVDAAQTIDSYCVLKNGNATVEFAVSDLEHSEDDEVAIPFEVIIEHTSQKKEMIFDCIAKRADEEEGELLLESVSVKPLGSEEGAYSPSFVELNEDVQQSFFDYLEDHGVNTEFAEILLQIAEDKEQDLYVKWLHDVHTFVKDT
ncbi:Mitochondrial acidic protein MAM33 [Hondaea fermentalgiana]|uniref:Mitochondrial acidic protein MAM33 n=1 Tax=Hondaea fermentalgiana TaxID=2315210 RepID=A0A2R5GYQ7_9STRA|nr:Mitochondrial acidic protein MAM33 [Hondaea fermentalgiana]|eukprot:GBG33601.1 Mitochondrial acidic protein MAM33 [Hondaea fermentalgiana]